MERTTREEVRDMVYKALADIAYETGCTNEDMKWALDWTVEKFFEDIPEE